MLSLVYVSTAVKPFTGSELFDLLSHSREKNTRRGITGLLLYKDGSFMQALEGEEEGVRSLYAAISADARHYHVITLVDMPIAERQFPNWTMGFKNLGEVDLDSVPGYNPHPILPPPHDEMSWQASVAMSLLATFMDEN